MPEVPLVELWPCKGQRARTQGSVLYYHIVLYTLPEGIVEGEAARGDDGREGKRSDYCQRTTEQIYILLCDV